MKRSRVLVFAGAGASFAVNRKKYPTTVEFVGRLPSEVRDHRLIQHLSSHFERKFGDKTPDVEKVLWCLDELHGHLGQIFAPEHPASWVIPSNNLPSLVGHKNGNVSESAVVARTALTVVTELRSRINSHIYSVYGEQPTSAEFADNWGALLQGLVNREYWLDIVTTNYDLVIEEVIDSLDLNISYGQKRGVIPRLDLDIWRNIVTEKNFPQYSGLLTKLHGSLNWERDEDNVVFSGRQFKTDHKHHAAIYPGFKGVPDTSPFDLFHDYFERALQSCDVAIFIGFAFRDEYINTLLRRAPVSQRYIVVDPSSSLQVPTAISARTLRIKSGFDVESVGLVLADLQRKK